MINDFKFFTGYKHTIITIDFENLRPFSDAVFRGHLEVWHRIQRNIERRMFQSLGIPPERIGEPHTP